LKWIEVEQRGEILSLAAVYSRSLAGIEAPEVVVEVMLSRGLPGISIIGLPEAAVREAKDRVRGALISGGYKIPQRRITINLAPADLPKSGARLDLPIALGILVASGQLSPEMVQPYESLGELALDGRLRPVRGILPAALEARDAGRILIVPKENAEEASHVEGLSIVAVESIQQLVAYLLHQQPLELQVGRPQRQQQRVATDLSQVRGQQMARRALEIAAAGGHHLLLVGPPGTGKTLLSSTLPGILPPMSEVEALESATIYSVNQTHFDPSHWGVRPFRTPHHTASGVALVGGGSHPRPGEISLAHQGVLFLDELPEFSRSVLEVLREPIESGKITISRAAAQTEFPAQFQLIAAMNPCPCGFHGDSSGKCHCSPDQIKRYHGRISGPLLDRIDLHVEVPRVASEVLTGLQETVSESSELVRQRVAVARERQQQRQQQANSQLQGEALQQHAQVNDGLKQFLSHAIDRLGLSGRGYHRIVRVARTIADLAGEVEISHDHIAEALAFRKLDRDQ
jgi:magnesium chelatase family protein